MCVCGVCVCVVCGMWVCVVGVCGVCVWCVCVVCVCGVCVWCVYGVCGVCVWCVCVYVCGVCVWHWSESDYFNVNFNANFKTVFKTIQLCISWWKSLITMNLVKHTEETATNIPVFGGTFIWRNCKWPCLHLRLSHD
jgi:hypothetical protein